MLPKNTVFFQGWENTIFQDGEWRITLAEGSTGIEGTGFRRGINAFRAWFGLSLVEAFRGTANAGFKPLFVV